MTEALAAPAPQPDSWSDQVEALLARKVAAGREHRNVGALPSPEHGSAPVLAMLVEVRSRMDSVEVLLTEIMAFRTQARVLMKESEAAVEDKWAQRVISPPTARRRASFDGSFDVAPRERYAAADVHVIDERREARRRERVMDACSDAVDQLRLAHRGLDGVRMDLHVMNKGVSVETRLER